MCGPAPPESTDCERSERSERGRRCWGVSWRAASRRKARVDATTTRARDRVVVWSGKGRIDRRERSERGREARAVGGHRGGAASRRSPRSLLMIGLALPNRHRAVDLLHEHQPREAMRERHLRQRELLVRRSDDVDGNTVRAADDERKLVRASGKLLDARRELLARARLPVDRQRHDVRTGRNRLAKRGVVAHLDLLDRRVVAQAAEVLVDGVAIVRFLQLADGDDADFHASMIR